MKRIYIVRHGERYDHLHPEWKKTAREPHDPPLSTTGKQQARQTGAFIYQREFELINQAINQSNTHNGTTSAAKKHSKRYSSHRKIQANNQSSEASFDDLASISIFSSPFLRCVQTSKCLSEAYCAELLSLPDQSNNQTNNRIESNHRVKPWHEIDVQIKIEHGLAEFLTPLNFKKQMQPLSMQELNDELEGELDKFYESQHPFPQYPETVRDLYARLQSTFINTLNQCQSRIIVLCTHGYGVQVLSEFLKPGKLVWETRFCCVSAATARLIDPSADASDQQEGNTIREEPRSHIPDTTEPVSDDDVPSGPSIDPLVDESGYESSSEEDEELPHAKLIPPPIKCDWSFEVESWCNIDHWCPDSVKPPRSQRHLANPLPSPSPQTEPEDFY